MTTSSLPRFLLTTGFSIGMSLILIGALVHAFAGSAGADILPRLVRALRETSLSLVGCYVLTSIAQTLFRALRYQVILQTGAAKVPGLVHLFIVSMSRNMFVDLLPARLGELSFIAMLNRGYRMKADVCLAALSISFIFDLVALGILLCLLLIYQLAAAVYQPWLIGVILAVFILCGGALVALFPVLKRVAAFLRRQGAEDWRWLGKIVRLVNATSAALQQAAGAGIVTRVVMLSLGVRIFKYLGLYLLFLAVVLPGFEAIRTGFGSVLIALVSAEASASLPVPAFMSFGSYEAGGALAMIALGANKVGSLIIMLALHLWSQVIDYSLGIAALIVFFAVLFQGTARDVPARPVGRSTWILAALVLLAGLLFAAYQLRGLQKMGGLTPPSAGQPLLSAVENPVDERLRDLRGFVVWSSNRAGNHDIIRMSLPDGALTRLTSHPHSEYFPRISPDGLFLVFARGHEPYVSQRNALAWGVVMLDLTTGAERVITDNGNVPTWSADGSAVRFQRNGNQFVEYDLASGRETVLMQSGRTIAVPDSVVLETPVWSDARSALAVTLRGRMRGTFVIGRDGQPRQVGDGCELAWSPDSTYLYYVDHGGKMKNAFYKVDPDSLTRTLWFDAPSEFSHEYFPRVANTGDVLVYGASTGDHEHDRADYEIFLWKIGSPHGEAIRLTHHTGNDNWPDIHLYENGK